MVAASTTDCVANVELQNAPGKPQYGTQTYAHECTVTVRDLPIGVPIYLVISSYMEGFDLWEGRQWWSCPTKEIELTAKNSKDIEHISLLESEKGIIDFDLRLFD